MGRAGISGIARQRGMGMIGWMLTLVVGGFVVLTALRAVPLYYDFWAVKSVLDDVAQQPASRTMNRSQLWNAVSSRLSVNSIGYIKEQNFTTQRVGDSKQILRISYEAKAPLVGNAELLFTFDHQATTP